MSIRWIGVLCACALLAGCPDDGSGDGGGGGGGSGGDGRAGVGGRASDGGGSSGRSGTGGTSGGGDAGSAGLTGGDRGGDTGGGGSAGSAGRSGAGRGGAGDDQCTQVQCLRAFECAESCSDASFLNGCCPCPEGTIDVISCPADDGGGCGASPDGCGVDGASCCDPFPCDGPNFCKGGLSCCGSTCAASCDGGFCGLPCSGVAPDEEVSAACSALTTPEACAAYSGTGFPSSCEWHTPGEPPCLAP